MGRISRKWTKKNLAQKERRFTLGPKSGKVSKGQGEAIGVTFNGTSTKLL